MCIGRSATDIVRPVLIGYSMGAATGVGNGCEGCGGSGCGWDLLEYFVDVAGCVVGAVDLVLARLVRRFLIRCV